MIIAAFYFLIFLLWPLADGRYSFWREEQDRRKAQRAIRTGAMTKPGRFYDFK